MFCSNIWLPEYLDGGTPPILNDYFSSFVPQEARPGDNADHRQLKIGHAKFLP
jgi:hypothetical protein